MARAHAKIGLAHYAVHIDANGHKVLADEPRSNGGANAGPDPYDLLLASLAACTAITLRMYADRKQWDLKSLSLDLHYIREGEKERIERKLSLAGNLNDEQRARIADIAERTPVTLTLKRGLSIHTELVPASSAAVHAAEVDKRLDEALAESFPASDTPTITP
jgi:putative redox protein